MAPPGRISNHGEALNSDESAVEVESLVQALYSPAERDQLEKRAKSNSRYEKKLENIAERKDNQASILRHVKKTGVREEIIEETVSRYRALKDIPNVERFIRGALFEQMALKYLDMKDIGSKSPRNPELATIILEVTRNPKGFIEEFQDLAVSALAREHSPITEAEEKIIKELMKEKKTLEKQLLERPRNNDAIALNFELDAQTGELVATVGGSFEMKNYGLYEDNKRVDVIDQLTYSARNITTTIKLLGKFLPQYARWKGVSGELPYKVNCVDREDFKQTIVQPGGAWNPESLSHVYTIDQDFPFSINDMKKVYDNLVPDIVACVLNSDKIKVYA